MPDSPSLPPDTGKFTDIYNEHNADSWNANGSQSLRSKDGKTLYEHKSWSLRKLKFWSDWYGQDPEDRENKKWKGATLVKQALDDQYGKGFGDRVFKHIRRTHGRDLDEAVTRGDLSLIRRSVPRLYEHQLAAKQPASQWATAARRTVNEVWAAMTVPENREYFIKALGGVSDYNDALDALKDLSNKFYNNVPGNRRQVQRMLLAELKHIGITARRSFSFVNTVSKSKIRAIYNGYADNPKRHGFAPGHNHSSAPRKPQLSDKEREKRRLGRTKEKMRQRESIDSLLDDIRPSPDLVDNRILREDIDFPELGGGHQASSPPPSQVVDNPGPARLLDQMLPPTPPLEPADLIGNM